MILPIKQNYNRGQSFRSSVPVSKKMLNAFNYKSIDKNSAEYIEYVYYLLKQMCRQTAEINVETERLQDIAELKEPAVFIMNHTAHQMKDINAAKFFNALLYREYIYHNRAESCPRSKIFANKNILKKQPDSGEEYKWLGVIPINAGIRSKGKVENANTIRHVVQELAENKINFFIFPEGSLAGLTFLPLKYKFQPGVSAIIKKVLEFKDKINVFPLGFAHNKDLSAIHIGNPVLFCKNKETYTAGRGNINSEFFDKNLADFYSGKDEIVLTEKGKPVNSSKVVPYISGILAKNLECCTKEAQRDLQNSGGRVFEI